MARISGRPDILRCLENCRARFDHAFGIEAENFSEGTFCALPDRTMGTAKSYVSATFTGLEGL